MILVCWLALICFTVVISSSSVERIKVAIVGGGPAGLLAAHALLSRKNTIYDVNLFEAKEDPRFTPPGPRSYSLGLNIRGRNAINYFDTPGRSSGLWKELAKVGIESDRFFLHINKRKFQLRDSIKKDSKGEIVDNDSPPPTLLISRDKLCSVLLQELENKYLNNNNINESNNLLSINYGWKLKSVNLLARSLKFENNSTFEYDWVLGCDGVQSIIRKTMMFSNYNNNDYDYNYNDDNYDDDDDDDN
jgi:kynurenine 3-monooxygenase